MQSACAQAMSPLLVRDLAQLRLGGMRGGTGHPSPETIVI